MKTYTLRKVDDKIEITPAIRYEVEGMINFLRSFELGTPSHPFEIALSELNDLHIPRSHIRVIDPIA